MRLRVDGEVASYLVYELALDLKLAAEFWG
jgi:hypothetical protein